MAERMSESAVDTEEVSRNSGKSDSNKASTSSKMSGDKPVKRMGKRPGRKPSKIDVKAKLERSRQSARECRARKKLRYQYLEELVMNREKAIYTLREELEMYRRWCKDLDEGHVPDDMREKLFASDNKNSLDLYHGTDSNT